MKNLHKEVDLSFMAPIKLRRIFRALLKNQICRFGSLVRKVDNSSSSTHHSLIEITQERIKKESGDYSFLFIFFNKNNENIYNLFCRK